MSPLYFLETQAFINGRKARYFLELDRDKNSRAHIISLIRSGEVEPVKVLEVCEDENSCRDVTEEIKREALALEAAE